MADQDYIRARDLSETSGEKEDTSRATQASEIIADGTTEAKETTGHPAQPAHESTADIMAANMRANLDSGTTGVAVSEGIGSVGGLAAGAVIGSIAGPIGTLIGAVAGAVGGWWAGREVAESAELHAENAESHYRDRFASYDESQPLYQLGYIASHNPEYAGRAFDDIEPELQRGWNPDMQRQYGPWSDVRDTLAQAYDAGHELNARRATEESREAL